MCLTGPEDGVLTIPGIYNQPLQAYLLADASKGRLNVDRVEDALIIHLSDFPTDRINSVVVLDVLGKPDISNPPIIKRDHDIFVDIISVIIESDRENVEIRFTLDGTMPDITSPLYTEPLLIHQTTPIAARCFRDSKAVSDSAIAWVKKVKPLPPVETDQVVPGLLCQYYEGEWDSLPDFISLTPIKSIEVSTFDLSPRLHDDYYGFMYDGFIQIPEDGVYRFYTESDDGSNLYIDDSLVVENDGLHGMETKKGEIPLSKGLHKIRVKYFEKNGGDDLKIYIDGPGIKKIKVPDTMLYKPKKK
ncbi:MAG: PA14 domain-containing protein [Bacteroidales bacterium]